MDTPIISFIGWSGSGKTTFIEKLIPVLHGRGLRVAVVKYDGHDFQMDKEGKDTWRFTKAGAECVAIANKAHAAILENRYLDFHTLVDKIRDVDLIIAEGWNLPELTKIELLRGHEDMRCTDMSKLCAVITDRQRDFGVPVFGLEDFEGVADYIIQHISEKEPCWFPYSAAVNGAVELTPIAHIRTDLPEKFGLPRQSGLVEELRGVIVFEPEYRNADALRGLDGFSHLWLIWGFSANRKRDWSPTVRPPRLGGNVRMGVFATRSPYRPNPLGLSCVRIERIETHGADGAVIEVSGIDLMDGTPIYDIKPYLPYADAKLEALGGFTDETERHLLRVSVPDAQLQKIPQEGRAGLLGVLENDPRPAYQHDPQRVYGLSYADFEIKFRVDGEELEVMEINGKRSVCEVVAALICDGDRFMICQRPAHKTRGLLWEFVGGKVERGETERDALIRECREELGVTVNPGELYMELVHEYPDLTVHLSIFNASISDGVPQLLEHNDIRWITPAEIPQYEFCPADEKILEKLSES